MKLEGYAITDAGTCYPMNISRPSNNTLAIGAYAGAANISVETGTDRRSLTGYVTIWYTKTS